MTTSDDRAVSALERIVLHACKTASPSTVSTYGIPAYAEAISTLVALGRMEYLPTDKRSSVRQARVMQDDPMRSVRASA